MSDQRKSTADGTVPVLNAVVENAVGYDSDDVFSNAQKARRDVLPVEHDNDSTHDDHKSSSQGSYSEYVNEQ